MTKEAKVLLGIVAAVVVGLITVFVVFNNTASTPAAIDLSKLVRIDSHKLGSGRVELVEFADYQCPACAQSYPITKQLIADYQGKLTFVFRNFPLPMHRNAIMAAESAEAAGSQGKFWEMHDKLYQAQSEWSDSSTPLDIFSTYASEMGLDVAKFKQAVQSNKFADQISQDTSDANSLGVQGTPTFYVNGILQSSYSYDGLKRAIDNALSR